MIPHWNSHRRRGVVRCRVSETAAKGKISTTFPGENVAVSLKMLETHPPLTEPFHFQDLHSEIT